MQSTLLHLITFQTVTITRISVRMEVLLMQTCAHVTVLLTTLAHIVKVSVHSCFQLNKCFRGCNMIQIQGGDPYIYGIRDNRQFM